jgi:hypothetical protein
MRPNIRKFNLRVQIGNVGIMQETREPANMAREELLSRITINPNVWYERSCSRGHRIWVSLI